MGWGELSVWDSRGGASCMETVPFAVLEKISDSKIVDPKKFLNFGGKLQ